MKPCEMSQRTGGESWISCILLILLDETVLRLLVRTGLNEYELAMKLVQLVHLKA